MIWMIAAGSVLGITGLWAGYTVVFEGGLETPKHSLVEKHGAIELRDYQPFRVASTALSGQEESASTGFRILAGYIFGDNDRSEKMAMTAPVIEAPEASGMTMSFVMPTAIPDLPGPNRDAVELTEIDWGRSAVLRFGGSGNWQRFEQHEVELREWCTEQGLTARGDALYAQYNSPSAFPLLRRNEVILPLVQ